MANGALVPYTGPAAGLASQIVNATGASGGGFPPAAPIQATYTMGAGAAPVAGAAGAGAASGVMGGAAGAIGAGAAPAIQQTLMQRLAPQLGAGALAKAGGYATAGMMAGGLVNNFNVGGEGSGLDQALTGAVTGAGMGAAVGSVFPVIGTGIGAAVGGAGGALLGLLGPKHADSAKAALSAASTNRQKLSTAFTAMGLDPSTAQQLLRQYDASTIAALAINPKDKKAVDKAFQAIMNQGSAAVGDTTVTDTAAQIKAQVAQALASQHMIASVMAPYASNLTARSNDYGNLLAQYASEAPSKALARAIASQASEAKRAGADMAASVMSGAFAGPALEAAKQAEQYSLAQAKLKAASATSSPTGDLASALASLKSS